MEKKILLFDIETAPNLSYVWGQWEQNVIAHKKQGYPISFAYKWLNKGPVKAYSLPDFLLYRKEPENELELAKKLWELFDEADIVIAHNGDQFDVKKANTFLPSVATEGDAGLFDLCNSCFRGRGVSRRHSTRPVSRASAIT